MIIQKETKTIWIYELLTGCIHNNCVCFAHISSTHPSAWTTRKLLVHWHAWVSAVSRVRTRLSGMLSVVHWLPWTRPACKRTCRCYKQLRARMRAQNYRHTHQSHPCHIYIYLCMARQQIRTGVSWVEGEGYPHPGRKISRMLHLFG